MSDILQKIIEQKKVEVEKLKTEALFSQDKACTSGRNLIKNLSKTSIALIAEVKKASPSKGLIREKFNPVEIAISYEKAGASAISVLTDKDFFQGSKQYLKDIREVVQLPILRKDFIIDAIQVYETKKMGADIILLIAAALSYEKLKELYDLSLKNGLEVLLEVHNQHEMEMALDVGAQLIGINNRNLSTFEVDIDNTVNLIKNNNLSQQFIIAESGIFTNNDVKYVQGAGASGVLVGESLMKQENIELAVKNLMGF